MARLAAGLTQSDLADILGVDKTLVCRWEHGQEPRCDSLRRIGVALKLTVGELVG